MVVAVYLIVAVLFSFTPYGLYVGVKLYSQISNFSQSLQAIIVFVVSAIHLDDPTTQVLQT